MISQKSSNLRKNWTIRSSTQECGQDAAGHHQYAKAISLFLVEMMRVKVEEPETWRNLVNTPVIRRT